MQLSAKTLAQTITLSEKKAPLGSVLKKIKKQSGYAFLYQDQLLRKSLPVDIDVVNGKLEEVLNIVFKDQPLTYEIIADKLITVKEKNTRVGNAPAPEVSLAMDITGTVVNEKKEPLAGASVMIKGTQRGTTTGSDGRYLLKDVDKDATLVISIIGYQTREIAVNGRAFVPVIMESSETGLADVVVIGYGTQKKSSVTASISKIQNDILDQVPSGRMETAIIGRMAGVNISTQHDRPGEAPEINIRGYNSISASNSPLVVIDGVPGGNLGQLDMNDVESIEVLKDASSAAIYGSRGAGGVVMVTTKKGSNSGPVLSVNGYFGMSKPMLYNDWIMGKEWYDLLVKYQNRAFATTGGDISIPMIGDPRRPPAYQLDSVIYQLPQTAWEKEVTRTAPIQNYNLSVRGGSEKVKYYISGTVADEQGVIKTASYRTYSFRANLSIKVSKAIEVGVELNPYFTKQRLAGGGSLINLNKYPPFVPPYKVDGKYPRTIDYAYGHSGQASPYTFIYGTQNYNNAFTNIGNAYINIKLAEGLSLRTSLGTNIWYNINNNFAGGVGDPQVASTGYVTTSSSLDLVNENVLSYNKTFNKNHDFGAILGASYQNNTSQKTTLTAVANSFNNDIIQTLNNALINPSASTSSKTQWGLISYFGRVNYGYKEKYLLTASLRRDGSSRFGYNNKWGYFPSLSGAWRVSKEDFFQGVPVLSDLKLRASYGETGNFNIGDFQYLGVVSNAVFSPDNKTVNGIAQTSIANPDLSWEKVESYDIGIDIGLFRNRLNMSIDYYTKRTNGMLYQVNVPATTGFTSAIQNIGTVGNKGFEVEIQSRNLTGNFKWNTFFNFSTIKNKVLDLGGVKERIIPVSIGMDWLLRVGEPMFSYYAYKMTGVYQDQAQIDGSPHLAGTVPGNPIVEDIDKNGKIETEDRYIAGNYMPKSTWGMTNQFSWKGFDLSITLQASLGAKIFDEEYLFYQGPNLGSMRRSVNNQWWSKSDPGDGKTPGIAIAQLYSYITNTDYYIEDASYLNCRNINLGYNISGLVKNIGIKSMRVYFSMNNAFIIKNKDFHGYNPEGATSGGINGINSTPGFNQGSEPMSRRVVFGINVTL